MNKVRTAGSFVFHGVQTFRCAARGRYSAQTEAIRQMRAEILAIPVVRDAEQLCRDRRAVAADVRRCFNRIKDSRHG